MVNRHYWIKLLFLRLVLFVEMLFNGFFIDLMILLRVLAVK
jgi:hypothetical protein